MLFLPDEDPEHVRELHAHYIMVKNGFFQAGTKKHPYTSNLNIVMHGHEEDPKIPLYGTKVLGIRYSRLDLHGNPRSKTWTELLNTANAGDTQITLNSMNGDELDW